MNPKSGWRCPKAQFSVNDTKLHIMEAGLLGLPEHSISILSLCSALLHESVGLPQTYAQFSPTTCTSFYLNKILLPYEPILLNIYFISVS